MGMANEASERIALLAHAPVAEAVSKARDLEVDIRGNRSGL